MRQAFAKALTTLAEQDDRVFLLTADLGHNVLERFQDQFPDRFINVGVAEQNLIGVATGLAAEGYVPFVYSIASFVTTRCLEQIRLGPVLHKFPIRIVGTGAGFAYGSAGPTHYVHEDVAVLRVQPGLEIFAPLLPLQMEQAVLNTRTFPGPAYIRIGADKLDLPSPNESTELWQDVLTFGSSTTSAVYTWGAITEEACKAVLNLQEHPMVVALQRLSPPCPSLPMVTNNAIRVEESMPGASVFTDTCIAHLKGMHLRDPLAVSANANEHRARQGFDSGQIALKLREASNLGQTL